MNILMVYATTEGQTRKVVRYCGDLLVELGRGVEIVDAVKAEGVNPVGFDAAILAGSLHMQRYQASLVHFATLHAPFLNLHPTLFLSVSLSAAGDPKVESEGLEACVKDFKHQTEWRPTDIVHVAGAFRFTQYDFLKTWAMRHIAAEHDIKVEPGEDLELTDWSALREAIEAFVSK